MLLTRGLSSSEAIVRRPELLVTQTSPQGPLFPHKMAAGFPEGVIQMRTRHSHNVFDQSNLRNHTISLLHILLVPEINPDSAAEVNRRAQISGDKDHQDHPGRRLPQT